jgi:16S rRNA processing protein RimM
LAAAQAAVDAPGYSFPAMRDPHRLVRLGVFGAAQGVRGEVRVKSFTADPVAIGAYGPLTDKDGQRRFGLAVVRRLKGDMLIVRVKGVETRDAAEALAGVELFVRRSDLPPPGPNLFYYDDLNGLSAVTRSGEPFGRVVAVLNYGAGDILEIEPEGGGETVLLPFTEAVVQEIDFDAGRIVIEPPGEIEGDSE